jgi:hypothetical protein
MKWAGVNSHRSMFGLDKQRNTRLVILCAADGLTIPPERVLLRVLLHVRMGHFVSCPRPHLTSPYTHHLAKFLNENDRS